MFNWNWATRIGKRDASKTAYVRSYDASADFTFPEEFDLSGNSLLLTESIRNAAAITVILYWTSEERAVALEPVVVKALGVVNPQTIGKVVQVLTPAMPKWTENPARWGKWLVSAAALFGALSIIRDNFTDLFAAPDVVIFTANSASPNFHTGDPLDVPLVVRNQARLGHADVHLIAAQLLPAAGGGSPASLHFDISQLPQLQAGQQIPDVHVAGTAPALQVNQPRDFVLQVEADSKEGFFRRSKKAACHAFTIKVWPDRGSSIIVSRSSPSIAKVHVDLWPGVAIPPGLQGDLLFSSPVPPENGGIISLSDNVRTGTPILATGPSGILGKVSFQTDALQAFRGYSYEISISFPRPLTPEEWKSLTSSVKVAFT